MPTSRRAMPLGYSPKERTAGGGASEHPRVDALTVRIHTPHTRLGIDVVGMVVLRVDGDAPDGQGELASTVDVVRIVLVHQLGRVVVPFAEDRAEIVTELRTVRFKLSYQF